MSDAKTHFVDTSVLVRYLTNDVPELAGIAERIVDQGNLLVNSVILLECCYVLTKLYSYRKEQVADAVVRFLLRENVHMVDIPKELASAALLPPRDTTRVSFGDALIVASMRAVGVEDIYSFDRGFKAEGITVRGRLE